MKKIVAAILLSGLGLISMGANFGMVAAETDTERREEFVYGVNAYNGTLYQGVFHPPSVDTIYLLADKVNIISPRKTIIYYWAVTNE